MTYIAFVLDGASSADWNTVFWPFWVITGILSIATFLNTILLIYRILIKLFSLCEEDNSNPNISKQLKVTFWMFLNFAGVNASGICFVSFL